MLLICHCKHKWLGQAMKTYRILEELKELMVSVILKFKRVLDLVLEQQLVEVARRVQFPSRSLSMLLDQKSIQVAKRHHSKIKSPIMIMSQQEKKNQIRFLQWTTSKSSFKPSLGRPLVIITKLEATGQQLIQTMASFSRSVQLISSQINNPKEYQSSTKAWCQQIRVRRTKRWHKERIDHRAHNRKI